MQAILKVFMQWVVLPLTKDLAIFIGKAIKSLYDKIIKYFAEKKRKKELKKTNRAKVKAYEDADNIDDAADTFNKLP